jgi:hypothetical protein|tara:strand:- start:142 stop:357 length:216 start_codon:yes stop_codon:yes gene_type:complete
MEHISDNYTKEQLDHICVQYEKRLKIMRDYARKRYANDAEYRLKLKVANKEKYELKNKTNWNAKPFPFNFF